MRRKGYHEAIYVYIEQHTPIIIRKGNLDDPDETEFIVSLNNKEIDSADITCHKLLFDLDVKNIFTFNYDNCLDIIGNTDEAEKLIQLLHIENPVEIFFARK